MYVMDEGTSHFKVFGLRIREHIDMENQSSVLTNEGKQPFDRFIIYVFLDKNLHKVKGKLKRKLMNM